jgi:hypothetical protein
MIMTPQESFRFGFLTRCAEEQLSMDDIKERVKFAHVKIALPNPRDVFNGLKGLASSALLTPLVYTSALGGGAALLGGAGAGYGLAKMQETDTDPEEAKRQELIAVYKRYADNARMKAQNRSYRQAKPTNPSLF